MKWIKLFSSGARSVWWEAPSRNVYNSHSTFFLKLFRGALSHSMQEWSRLEFRRNSEKGSFYVYAPYYQATTTQNSQLQRDLAKLNLYIQKMIQQYSKERESKNPQKDIVYMSLSLHNIYECVMWVVKFVLGRRRRRLASGRREWVSGDLIEIYDVWKRDLMFNL